MLLVPIHAPSMLSSKAHRPSDLQPIPGSPAFLACPCKFAAGHPPQKEVAVAAPRVWCTTFLSAS